MTDTASDPFGELDRSQEQWNVRFVRHLPHSPERVWRALTDPAELAAWFPTTIDGELAAGAPLTFAFRTEPFPPFDGVMVAYEPLRLMEFRWGPDLVRIELEPATDGATLTLTDTFDERGKAARDAGGWHDCLDKLDFALLESDGEPPETWRIVTPEYQRRFGPEASTVGPPEGV